MFVLRREAVCEGVLNRFEFQVPGGSYVCWGIGERLAWFKSELFVFCADLAYGIVPAVVPSDASFASYDGPSAVAGINRLPGLAVRIEGDVEVGTIASAYLPLTDKAVPTGGAGCGFEVDACNVRGGDGLLMSVFENDYDWGIEVNAGDLRYIKVLPMSVLEDDRYRCLIVGRPSAGLCRAAGGGKYEQCESSERFDLSPHSLFSCL